MAYNCLWGHGRAKHPTPWGARGKRQLNACFTRIERAWARGCGHIGFSAGANGGAVPHPPPVGKTKGMGEGGIKIKEEKKEKIKAMPGKE